MQPPYPILEFDPQREAIIEPTRVIKPVDAPQACVVCFFREVIESLVASGRATEITAAKSEMGLHPIYELAVEGQRLALFHPGVGAPLAAGMLEEVIARGCRRFIACGGAGVLDRSIPLGHIVVPTSAIRDEGISYHYLPPAREVAASLEGVAAIRQTLEKRGIPHIISKTWTTDAIYRETPDKIRRRQMEGCSTVEMEAAAFFAVAHFRGVPFAQMLYGGDDVSGKEWDERGWARQMPVREKLFWLAAEACLAYETG